MKELELKYGMNPNQKLSRIYNKRGDLPFRILNGNPGYINFLDALNGWQLVKEMKEATGLPSATSFKHVSPAGVAVANPLDDISRKCYFVKTNDLSPVATAYVRARGADRMSSYGDFVALSDECDESIANILKIEFSDGIIAPSYTEESLSILKRKKKGNYVIIEIDKDYVPPLMETRDVFGITFEQRRNDIRITEDLLNEIVTKNNDIPLAIKRDMLVALITLKYTQSNSVCCVKDGQTIGIGAGQQSRVHCTRLACDKADKWFLRQNSKVLNLGFNPNIKRADRDNAIDVYISNDGYISDTSIFVQEPEPLSSFEKEEWLKNLTGVTLGSDAFFPFNDSIERAIKSGVRYVTQPGGSTNDQSVIESCNQHNIAMVLTKTRLFHH